MSMKEFDKMCENTIIGKPTGKQIYDERQTNIQHKCIIAALAAFSILLAVNNIFMEYCVQWISFADSVMLFMSLGLTVFVIGTSVSGAFFAVNTSGTFTRVILGIYVVLFAAQALIKFDENKNVIENGMLSSGIAQVICLGLMALSGIFAIIAYRIQKKSAERSAENE